MFLSIVIPIYNDEKYLEECLDSCLNQDIPYDDYEIICVDDGYTDRTKAILKEYSSRHKRVKPLFQGRHQGGRNIGMAVSQGDYIWFVDHDDFIQENVLAFLKSEILKHDCDRVTFPYYQFLGSLTSDELKYKNEQRLIADTRLIDGVVWASIIRKDFLIKNNIWPESKKLPSMKEGYWGTDSIFMMECQRYNIRSIHIDMQPVYFYRRSVNSDTARASSNRDIVQKKLYNVATYYRMIAQDQKKQYLLERERNGEASLETTVRMIKDIRIASRMFAGLSGKYWKQGSQQMRENNLFFAKAPAEYTVTSWDFAWMNHGRKLLRRFFYYYLFTDLGTKIFRLLDLYSLVSRNTNNPRKREIEIMIKRARMKLTMR